MAAGLINLQETPIAVSIRVEIFVTHPCGRRQKSIQPWDRNLVLHAHNLHPFMCGVAVTWTRVIIPAARIAWSPEIHREPSEHGTPMRR